IITRATTVLNEQAKSSAFRPVGLEDDFGLKGDIPTLKISLQANSELLLQGRIDRLDMAEQEDRTFLRIIDYKSSSHDLSLTEVYYGLALQMLTYLDIVVTNCFLYTSPSPRDL
ncbi:PD-(D/E)XK nuclease family protein, partial [Listeria monocytogenes]|uniref:PD-(D/E)XK nuclease family protein n=1 Tax=Listeria monocytogenes TaxID=1639 RepID=UPI00122D7BE4